MTPSHFKLKHSDIIKLQLINPYSLKNISESRENNDPMIIRMAHNTSKEKGNKDVTQVPGSINNVTQWLV